MKSVFAFLVFLLPFASLAQQMDDSEHNKHHQDSVENKSHEMKPRDHNNQSSMEHHEQTIEDDSHHMNPTDKKSQSAMEHQKHHESSETTSEGTSERELHNSHVHGPVGKIAIPRVSSPTENYSGPEFAADALFSKQDMAQARIQLLNEQGGGRNSHVVIDRLELNSGNDTEHYVWESTSWFGGDINKFWVKVKAEGDAEEALDHSETQFLWSRAISPWSDLQTGVKFDHNKRSSDKVHFGIGVHGLAQYMLEYDVFGYVSTNGDLSAHIESEYEFHVTQRLMFEPRIEIELSGQEVLEENLGDGLTNITSSVRFRYEFTPEFSPYLGVENQNHVGSTRDLLRSTGEKTSQTFFVFGLKLWL